MGESRRDLSDIRATARAIVALIRRFVAGEVGPYEWDDLMGVPFKNQMLETARLRAEDVVWNSRKRAESTGDDGARQLLAIAQEIELKLCGDEHSLDTETESA